ncbi:ABC transporter permease [Olivibacter sp. XZL3]|uniref:ABC transporter permease n=1 Tax=Olivibacter sp. XZL3 TaxID=1735116 RepID=UPI001066D340|nr:ABC transporter permease [Olivibacter sp. XZL3]
MIKAYLTIFWRNFKKNKVFSLINILGLAIGMGACLLIYTYIQFEWSYDNFHERGKRIYRLATDLKLPMETIHESATPAAPAYQLAQDFPEVEQFVRLMPFSLLVRKDDLKFQESNTLFVDSSFFLVFSFPLIKGNPTTALKEPFSLVLSETAAKKYFGEEDPIGQTLHVMADGKPVKVTAVMKDIPGNSSISCDLLVSMNTYEPIFNTSLNDEWGNFGMTSFLLVKDGANAQQLAAKFPAFLKERLPPYIRQTNMSYSFFLEPLQDLYLRSDRVVNKAFRTGNVQNIYIFSAVVLFLLIIAGINFINLSTARAIERAREVGIRKVAGAHRFQLMGQFLGEALIISVLAYVLSACLAQLLFPVFNQLAGKVIGKSIFDEPIYLLKLFVVAVSVGLLAGLYPALVLSGFSPIGTLKGRFSSAGRGLWLRKALVVGQFTVSVVLITVTIVVYKQLNYMRGQQLGFDKSRTLVVETRFDNKQEAFKQALADIPAVSSTTLSSSVPGGENGNLYSEFENRSGDKQTGTIDQYMVDYDFIPQYGIKVLAGRNFSKDFRTDSAHALLVNETMVKSLGYKSPEEAIGKRYTLGNGAHGAIIGVIADFHFQSLQQEISPLGLQLRADGFFANYISIKIAGGDLRTTIKAIEDKWQQTIPNRPFNYFFADEYFDRQYKAEGQFGKLFLTFTLLTIFISCLGLLALTAYSTLQRQKEIGIRKVLGARVTGIVRLLTADFLRLVFIAFILASPIAWISMKHWLSEFAYHIRLEWWIFMIAGSTAVMIAFLTVSFHAIRAAIANPVNSLRDE